MKRLLLSLLMFLTLSPVVAFGSGFNLELNANFENIEVKVDTKLEINYNLLQVGAGTLHSTNGNRISNINFSLEHEVLNQDLKIDLGFKGLTGKVGENSFDNDIGAVSFLFIAEYTLPERHMAIPVKTSVSIYGAPDPLCFSDLDRYLEIDAAIDFYVGENAAIVTGYRYITVNITDKDVSLEEFRKILNNDFFVGYKLSF